MKRFERVPIFDYIMISNIKQAAFLEHFVYILLSHRLPVWRDAVTEISLFIAGM